MFMLIIPLIVNGVYGETTKLQLARDYGLEFYCSVDDDVYLKFGENSAQTLPRILGVSDAGVCDHRSQGDIVQMMCGHISSPVSIILEYDDENVYSLARVTCQQRTRRAGFNISAESSDDQFGKIISRLNINMDYNDNSELIIECNANGNVYVTNPDIEIYKHVLTYNKGGSMCTALLIKDNVVEISNCDQMEMIEVLFSSSAFVNNIIGGNSDMRFYKFNCDDFSTDEQLLEKIKSVLRSNGATQLVTWSTVVISIIGSALIMK